MSRFGFSEATNAVPRMPSSAPQSSGPPYQSALEKNYPHILDAIQSMWGYRELTLYFRKLTLDDRGNRAGFPAEVWEEIHLLQHLHQEIVPGSIFDR